MSALAKNALSVVADGFDANQQDPTASPIRGPSRRFKDSVYLDYGQPIDASGRSFVVLDRTEGWQKLQTGCPAEYLMRKPGEPRPAQPHVAESDWPNDLNGKPAHPWKLTRYLYLLDATTGEISTFWTNTTGGRVAIDQLSDQVKFMRQARPAAVPVVALESRDMPTQFGGTKPRPHFRILGWRQRDNAGTAATLAGPEQASIEAPEQSGKTAKLKEVESPSLAEQLNDDLPDDLK
jgi:hypothetical protein